MANFLRRLLYHDYQPPKLYQAGVTLRRSFLTGPAATPEEESLKAILDDVNHVPVPDKLLG